MHCAIYLTIARSIFPYRGTSHNQTADAVSRTYVSDTILKVASEGWAAVHTSTDLQAALRQAISKVPVGEILIGVQIEVAAAVWYDSLEAAGTLKGGLLYTAAHACVEHGVVNEAGVSSTQ